MKTNSYFVKTVVAGVLSLSMVGAANADVIFGDGGTGLQGVLNGITTGPVAGSSSVNVVTDQLSSDELWGITGSGGSISTLIIEIAAFADGNEFGIYDATDSTNTVTLFGGAATAGDQVSLSIKADGSVYLNITIDTGIDFAGNHFGFFLKVTDTGNIWYSDTALNIDGMDHMAAYQGSGDTVQLPNALPGTWTPSEYVLAWEDLHANAPSDKDYTDFVVMIESVERKPVPVPEPGILALMGLGLLGFVGGRRFTTKA